ncbi:MAG: hypothetical protein IPJ31_15450 [Bacteroidetes bacterium]|nr:hypothetical protein [Bacteroidota bacterium]
MSKSFVLYGHDYRYQFGDTGNRFGNGMDSIGNLYLVVGAQWQGVGVALWGFLVIGSADNIARFVLQRRLADVHPLRLPFWSNYWY